VGVHGLVAHSPQLIELLALARPDYTIPGQGGVLLEGQADLAAYDRMFEQLRAFALSPARSALLLRDLMARKGS
jgi:hypothetical protein